MKTYEEIVKEVDKDFESYTLEDKVQAINVFSFDENNKVNTRSLSEEEYDKYFNDIRYNREMYLRSITASSENHKVKVFDILESDIDKLVPIDRAEAKTLLDRGIIVGYCSEKTYHGSGAGDYVFSEVADYEALKEADSSYRWTWYISPNCNVKDKILAEYEKSKTDKIEKKYLVETIYNGEGDVEFFDDLDEANCYAEQHYSYWTESEKKKGDISVGYVEKTSEYYFDDELENEDFEWYGYHSYAVPEGAFSSKDIKELEALKKRITEPCFDDNLLIKDMEDYGYMFVKSNQMLPITDDFAKELYCCNVEIYRLYSDDTEGLVESMDEINSHIECGGMFGIENDTWDKVRGRLDKLKDDFVYKIGVDLDFHKKVGDEELKVFQRLTDLVDLTDEQGLSR